MALTGPPFHVQWMVDAYSPGFWPRFMWYANQVLASGATPTSWYRTPGYNAMKGGHVDSQHLAGMAFDAVPNPNSVLTRNALATRMRANGFIAVVKHDHVHAQAAPPSEARRVGLLGALGV